MISEGKTMRPNSRILTKKDVQYILENPKNLHRAALARKISCDNSTIDYWRSKAVKHGIKINFGNNYKTKADKLLERLKKELELHIGGPGRELVFKKVVTASATL